MTVNQLLDAVGKLRARTKELETLATDWEQAHVTLSAEHKRLAGETKRIRGENRRLQTLLATIGQHATQGLHPHTTPAADGDSDAKRCHVSSAPAKRPRTRVKHEE